MFVTNLGIYFFVIKFQILKAISHVSLVYDQDHL